MGCTVLVLIPRVITKTRGIGLLETLWKVEEVLIDTYLHASLQLQDVLHGFRDRRGRGMSLQELNIYQEITSIDQDPLFLVFLDLRKAYDTVDQEHLIITL